MQPIAALTLCALLGTAPGQAQQAVSFKNFNQFRGIVPGVDFFAANRQAVVPFEKPAAEGMQMLATLLGGELPKGAVFICSTLQQKDSIYEPRVLRSGYGWVVVALTAEARAEEQLERIRQQMGGELPAEIMDRIRKRPPEAAAAAAAALARTTVRQMALAVLQAALAPDREYRFSRVEDVGRSPLPDWLDIGIASYVSGTGANVGFLQQHLEETFPLEDVLGMARPFVAPTSEGGGGGGGAGGGGMAIRMGEGAGGQGRSGPGQAGGGRGGGGSRVLPKDQQDRMLFDGQASTFFGYLVEKVGIEKVKELIQSGRDGKPSTPIIMQPDVLGADLEKVEEGWLAWVKTQKPEQPQEMRIRAERAGGRPPQPIE